MASPRLLAGRTSTPGAFYAITTVTSRRRPHCLRAAEDLEQQARYLVGNPLRSGLVDDVDAYPHWWCRWVARAADL